MMERGELQKEKLKKQQSTLHVKKPSYLRRGEKEKLKKQHITPHVKKPSYLRRGEKEKLKRQHITPHVNIKQSYLGRS